MELDPRTVADVAAYDDHARAYQETLRMARPAADVKRFADRAGRGAVVLDVACGPANDLRLLTDAGLHVIGVDLSLGALQFARLLQPRHGLVQAAIHDLPMRTRSFGGLWMNGAFTHLPREQWRETFAHLMQFLGQGAVHFACLQGTADMEAHDDPVLGEVHRSQATEDEVELLFEANGLRDVQVEVRPDPLLERRRPWVVALGRR